MVSPLAPSVAAPSGHAAAGLAGNTLPGLGPSALRPTQAAPAPAFKGGTATGNPPANVPPNPNFLSSCSGSGYDDSAGCVTATLQAIDNARAQEGLGPMTLPTNWTSLTPAEQLFVITNLERTVRGLTPLSAMATALDQSAAQGAAQSQDPTPPPGFPWSSWGSNWAGAVGNPLEGLYYWMYDDGMNSGNIDCTPSNTSGCWGHRENVLISLSCQPCLMGTGYIGNGYQGYPSWAELLVDTSGNQQLDYTWAQAVAFMPVGWAADDGQPNLLGDAGFQQPGLGPWNTTAGQNRAVMTSASAPAGPDYLATNGGGTGSATVYQDIPLQAVPGHSYVASVMLRSESGAPMSGTLDIWALAGTAAAEVGQTQITVGTTWSRFTTDVDVANPGHGLLRFQLYFPSSPANLDVAGAMLQDAAISDASFGQGLGPWNTAPGQNRSIYSGNTPSGQNYLASNTGNAPSSSVSQDVTNIPVDVGHTYAGSVFMRSESGSPVQASFDVWALGGTAPAELGQSQVTVSSTNWTQYFVALDIANPGHALLRMQVYFTTGGQTLDMTGAALEDGGAVDGSFDQPGMGPWIVSSGANAAVKSGSGAVSGPNWLETNTNGAPSSSVYQDFPGSVQAGQSYTTLLMMRSTTGSSIPVNIVIWALGGGAPAEVAQTSVTVGTSWAQYSSVLDVADAGHSLLRLQIFVGSSSQTLALDDVTLPDVALNP